MLTAPFSLTPRLPLPQCVGGDFVPGHIEKFCPGESISIEQTCLLLGFPVVACARRFLHLCNNDADLDIPICVYFEHKGAMGKSVTSTHLLALLRLWAGKIGFV